MENVSNILSKDILVILMNGKNFCNIGYINKVYTLDARNFGVPQSRERTFMISILSENSKEHEVITDYLSKNDLQTYKTEKCTSLSDF